MAIIAYRRKHQGMTLVEVLVAAIVVAIGLLGLAKIQISALQGSSDAYYRSRAIDFATSLSDRMHTNLIAVADNLFTAPLSCNAGSDGQTPNCVMTPTMSSASSITQCSPQQMARYDLHQIRCGQQGIEESLPGGRLQISCLDEDSTDGDPCSDLSRILITISWQRPNRATDAGTDMNSVESIVMTVIPGTP